MKDVSRLYQDIAKRTDDPDDLKKVKFIKEGEEPDEWLRIC